jgi:hypothetical protein
MVPVANAQVGWSTVPIEGAVGVTGAALINTLEDGSEVQVFDPVTVKVTVPAGMLLNVAVVPEPAIVVPTGSSVTVQLSEGNPLRATLPVATEQDGWVTVPIRGAEGVEG